MSTKGKKLIVNNLVYDLSNVVVPKDFFVFFDFKEVVEKSSEWQIILHEKKDEFQNQSNILTLVANE
jgi:hypothetical protein